MGILLPTGERIRLEAYRAGVRVWVGDEAYARWREAIARADQERDAARVAEISPAASDRSPTERERDHLAAQSRVRERLRRGGPRGKGATAGGVVTAP